MRVLVMGTGGVGGYFGALLGRAGHDLRVIARGAHLDALQTHGLSIETVAEDDFTVPVHALPAPEPDHKVDLVIVSVKSYDLDEAIAKFRPAVGPDTTVLTLLNGVESGERLSQVFGPERVLDGVVYIESFIKSPGVIAQVGGPRRAVFGNRNGPNGDREQRFFQDFLVAGWQVELAENVVQVCVPWAIRCVQHRDRVGLRATLQVARVRVPHAAHGRGVHRRWEHRGGGLRQ
jgi:2-dehydropantoate 2-reductase